MISQLQKFPIILKKNSSSTHKSKSNECTSSLNNNLKNSSPTQQSKSNDNSMSLECDTSSSNVSNNSKTLLQLKNQNQMNVLQH